jgi:hypothetical protein
MRGVNMGQQLPEIEYVPLVFVPLPAAEELTGARLEAAISQYWPELKLSSSPSQNHVSPIQCRQVLRQEANAR